ncbi:MAG: hypothetical protein WC911_02000 [Thermoleophilia bacterium]
MPGIPTSQGLRYLLNLRIGVDELQWWQKEEVEQRRLAVRAMTRNFGLVVSNKCDGSADSQWLVDDAPAGTDGVLYLTTSTDSALPGQGPESAILVTDDGDAVEFEGPDGGAIPNVIVPGDATWYTLVARASSTYEGPGTIQLFAGAGNVVGIDTVFTRYIGATDGGTGRGTLLRVSGSALGNDGDYTIETIVDGLTATVSPVAIANESGLTYTPIGTFLGATPANPELHERKRIVFALVARTREPAAGDYVVADVMRGIGVHPITVIDRRERNIWRPSLGGEHHCCTAFPMLGYDTGAATWGPVVETIMANAGLTSLTTSSGIGLLAAVQDIVAGDIVAMEYDAATSTWQNPGGGAAVTIAAGADDPAIIEVPASCGFTHICFYVDGGALYMARSTDKGLTFAAGGLIWNPPAVDAADYIERPAAILLKNHRIIVLCSYYDDSVSHKLIKYVYSDTYSATWVTNANVGYTWVNSFTLAPPATYDTTDPAIWQSDSGRIETCWQETGPGGAIRIRHAESLRAGELYSASMINRGYAIADHSQDQYSPCCFADDDGSTIVVYEQDAGLNADLQVSTVGGTSVIDDSIIVRGVLSVKPYALQPIGSSLITLYRVVNTIYSIRLQLNRAQRNKLTRF